MPEGIALFRLDVNTGFVLMSGDKGLMIVNPIAFGQVKPTDAIFDIRPHFGRIFPISIIGSVLICIDIIATAADEC